MDKNDDTLNLCWNKATARLCQRAVVDESRVLLVDIKDIEVCDLTAANRGQGVVDDAALELLRGDRQDEEREEGTKHGRD